MEFMAGESHYWPQRQCYRSAFKLPVLCVSVCVQVFVCKLACVELWMATPDSERNAGFTPVYQPLLALSAYKHSR